jgi:type III restriction enzyme
MLKELKEFQEKAVKELIDSCSLMLDLNSRKNVCVLKSPTGSGKTYMMAAFIERLIKRREDELCFIWVTIGKGDLQLQSRNSLVRYFNGSPVVHLIEEEFSGGREVINRNEVVVVNWEKVRNKVKATSEWSNNLMKDGEKTNFREVLANTRLERKIVLIIDESHIGAIAERTQELREEFDAHVVVEVSATPKLIPDAFAIKNGTGDLVQVSPADVIEEGLIKKDIIINQGLDDDSFKGVDSQTVVLEKAYLKRIELQNYFDELDVDINPLVLIQIPNAEEGEKKIEAILNFLSEKDITESNGRLAIWLNNYPSSENLDGISINTNPVQFLIFKQAIDTGWDCPRAHILIKFRETKSETFEIQILGRILRMPEQMHYGIDALNDGYVFTNITDIKVAREEDNPNIIKHLKMKRSSVYKDIALPSYYKSRADYGDITGDFSGIFEKEACRYFGISSKDADKNLEILKAKGLDTKVEKLKDIVIADAVVNSQFFDELIGDVSSEKHAELSKSDNDTQAEFNKFLERHMGTFTNVARSLPSMKAAMFTFFRNYLGIFGRKDVSWLQKMILDQTNLPHFEILFTNAVSAFSVHKELEVKNRVEGGEQFPVFEVPKEIYVNEYVEEVVVMKKNIMNPCYLVKDRSNVEKIFEKIIDSNESVQWWFKNGVNKVEYLGVKYFFPANRIKSFYPDYIVQYKDGTLGIFETKSKGDDENLGGFNEKTKRKAEALFNWKKGLTSKGIKVRAGIVLVVSDKSIYINEKQNYDIEKAVNNDLSDWIPFT